MIEQPYNIRGTGAAAIFFAGTFRRAAAQRTLPFGGFVPVNIWKSTSTGTVWTGESGGRLQ